MNRPAPNNVSNIAADCVESRTASHNGGLNTSRIAVPWRKWWISGGSPARTSDPMNSATARSGDDGAMLEPDVAESLRWVSARSARPVGHPSVCSSIRRTRSGEGTDPCSSRSCAASTASKTRSDVPISSTSPRTRRRPPASHTSRRPATTSWTCSGRRSRSRRSASWQSRDRISSRLSNTRTSGSSTTPIEAANPGTTRPSSETSGVARSREGEASSSRTRSTPAMIDAISVATSSSARSNDTHATARSSCSSQSTSSVVFPYPTGADTTTSGRSALAVSRLVRRFRRTNPERRLGTPVFAAPRTW